MKIIKLVKNTSFYIYMILVVSFVSKLFNLNYNSPSGDEAVYVAIGHSILFNWNWAIYNFASWLGGHAYFYPIITSIAYFYNGIIGSRLVNVIFSLVATYYVYLITEKVLKRTSGGLFKSRIIYASLFSAVIFAFSYTTILISRLATYDMPSFAFLLIGIYILIDLCDKRHDDQVKAKKFFLSSIFLSLSFAFKYISILYLPLILGASFIYINRFFKKSLMKYWIYYLLLPLLFFVFILSITQFNYLFTYISYQIVRESFGVLDILNLLVNNIVTLLPFIIFSIAIFVHKKRKYMLLFYLVWLVVVILFHLLTGRISALDKHIIYIVFPTAIFSGFGLYGFLKRKVYRLLTLIVIVVYVVVNLSFSGSISKIWPNFNTALNYFNDNLKSRDIVLSENRSSLILTSDKNFPSENVVTFDWFDFKNNQTVDAYKNAVYQGYFKYIVLEKDNYSKPERYKEINLAVSSVLDKNYIVVLENENYTLLKRVF